MLGQAFEKIWFLLLLLSLLLLFARSSASVGGLLRKVDCCFTKIWTDGIPYSERLKRRHSL